MSSRLLTPDTDTLTPLDIDAVKQTRDTIMAATPPDSPVTSYHRNIMERDLFLPGETTLARSDEETCPLDMEEMKSLLRAPYRDFFREMNGLRPSDWLRQVISTVYPPAKDVIKEYRKRYQVRITALSLVEISGWRGSAEGAKKWFQLSVKHDNPHLKELAKELGDLLKKSGYPELSCIILLDTYSNRTTSDTISQFTGQLQKATHQPIEPNAARSTLDLTRHFSLVSGSAIGPCFEKPKDRLKGAWEGTISAYLTNGTHVVGISNSHVVGNQGDKQAEEYRDLGPHAPKYNYQLPADITYDRVRQQLPQHIENLQDELTTAEGHENQKQRPWKIEEAQQKLQYAKKFRDDTLVRFNTAAKRRIGHTLWASGLTAAGSISVDVGVVILDLAPGVKPENRMPVVGRYTPSELRGFMQLGNPATYPRLKYSDPKWIHFRPGQYATESFIRRPPSVYNDINNDILLSTMMTGRSSGTTTGILLTEGYERVLPTPDGEDDVYVKDYVVEGRMGTVRTAFSTHGDSGAMCIVPSVDGHPLLLGIVTGGAGLTDSTDRTFIYPWFAFVELLQNLVEKKVLPKGPHKWSMDMDLLTST